MLIFIIKVFKNMHFNSLLTYLHYFIELYHINILIFINNIILAFILIKINIILNTCIKYEFAISHHVY